MKLPERSRHYMSPLYDSARWDSIALRPGDVIVATPYKAGTTWTQYLCAMALHGGPELPLPLSELTTWVDTKLNRLDDVISMFEGQPWRRVLKTHTPLDGLSYREDISYVAVARDPRGAFLSMCDHNANFRAEKRAELLRAAGLPENLPIPTDVEPLFRLWMMTPSQPWLHDGFPFGPYFHQSASFWEFRDLPNVHLMHYRELRADLPCTFDRLAAFLGAEIDGKRREAILAAASLDAMRESADTVAPLASRDVWKSRRAFFHSGRMEAWRDGLSSESQALYKQLTRKRYPQDFLNWIESGVR